MWLFLVLCAIVVPGHASAPQEPGITVTVYKAQNEAAVGARVFVLSDTGQELVAAKTDRSGMVRLEAKRDRFGFVQLTADQAGKGRPAFLLVEHDHFFIGGLRWTYGQQEYFIVLAPREVR